MWEPLSSIDSLFIMFVGCLFKEEKELSFIDWSFFIIFVFTNGMELELCFLGGSPCFGLSPPLLLPDFRKLFML